MWHRLSYYHRDISVTLLCLYWMLPGDWLLVGHEQQLVHPFDVFIVIALLFLFHIFPRAAQPSQPDYRPLCGLLVLLLLKSLLFWLSPPQGLAATFYPNPHWQGTPESVWNLNPIDEPISHFVSSMNYVDNGFSIREQTFPLHFVNDSRRFNWYGDEVQYLRRKQFLFSAKWKGFLNVDTAQKGLVLSVKGGHALVKVGPDPLRSRVADSERKILPLDQGIHPIEIHYSHDSPGERSLLLGWLERETVTPVAGQDLASRREQLESPLSRSVLTWLLNLGWLVLLVAICRREIGSARTRVPRASSLTAILIYGFLAYLSLSELLRLGRDPGSQILPAGGDPFVYETQARAILFGDFLNTSLTGDTAFYWNVLYRYLLAVLHVLFGGGHPPGRLGTAVAHAGVLCLLLCGYPKALWSFRRPYCRGLDLCRQQTHQIPGGTPGYNLQCVDGTDGRSHPRSL